MRDFLPEEKARREHVLGVIRREFRNHGFDEIETPVMEDSSRLHAGLGGDNEKLAYAVLKRGLTTDDYAAVAQGGDPLALVDLGLRFDLTVPLARFYATHQAELPSVFRAIQIAPVWRAERPQKGRYRQFVQCDIDIIGEPSWLAEVELIVATAATLGALGLNDCRIHINDRRLLTSMLDSFGFSVGSRELVMIVLDKLDKIAVGGVVAELRDRAPGETTAIDALESFLTRARTMEFVSFGDRAIRRELPDGIDEDAVRELVDLGNAVEAAGIDRSLLQFDPFLVRGMGYYTGTIFEVTHPDLGYSLGGGGRYDGMIGRFLGTDVSATGFSLGFERLVDLVELENSERTDAIALVYDDDVPAAKIAALKTQVLRDPPGVSPVRVRLERRIKNTKVLLDQLSTAGYTRYAFVGATTELADLDFRPIAAQ
ncbi:MAG: histidyl-tRNA synthetase [Actinomycetota bacterium]|nr:histidyl-tRNA synthetase [Actinomycetota bacterium]